MSRETVADHHSLTTASVRDTLALVAEVVAPTFGKGIIIRRPKVVAIAEKLGFDSRAVRRMQILHGKYGSGPLLLAIPGIRAAVILSPDDVKRVLEAAPEPFAPASSEKASALAHFEPKVSLISTPPERTDRRRFNEQVLETGRPVHSMAGGFAAVVHQEAGELLSGVGENLSWEDFTIAWQRVVRRVVLGDSARDDHELTDMLAKLRSAANWAFLHPGREKLLKQFHASLEAHLARAERGSLAARIAALPKTSTTEASDQVAHYLFAFDPAGIATFRTLALLATHMEQADRAREEAGAAGREGGRTDLPFIRACMLDCLRLWPTTPVILRQTTQDVEWDAGTMARNTHLLIFAPFFHRDDTRLPYAHRFAPDLWLGERPGGRWPLVPFSGGPAMCPAVDLVPMLASTTVAAILAERRLEMEEPGRLDPQSPLPGTLDNYSIHLKLRPLQA